MRWILSELKYDSALGTLNDFDDSRVRSLHKPDERYSVTAATFSSVPTTITTVATLPNSAMSNLYGSDENPLPAIAVNNERTIDEYLSNRNGNILRDHNNQRQVSSY